jgi:POT family proton-dependent oligopeptide transporter
MPNIVGMMMGAWFLATAASEYMAAILAKFASVATKEGAVENISEAIATYKGYFTYMTWVGIGFGLLLLLLSPYLKKHMHGVR